MDTFINYLLSELAPYSEIPIFISLKGDTPTHPYILFNTEQLTRTDMLNIILNINKSNPPVEIWDYSAVNVDILNVHNIKAKYLSVVSPKWYVDLLKTWRTSFTHDIGFSGWPSQRRLTILNKLINRTITINNNGHSETRRITCNFVQKWGNERDQDLAKCRILINIHCDNDYKVFESARCEPWLQINVPVVSETSLDNDSRCINVDYDDLVDTTVTILNKLFV